MSPSSYNLNKYQETLTGMLELKKL